MGGRYDLLGFTFGFAAGFVTTREETTSVPELLAKAVDVLTTNSIKVYQAWGVIDMRVTYTTFGDWQNGFMCYVLVTGTAISAPR